MMSTRTIHYCDACGKEIDPELHINKLKVSFDSLRTKVGFTLNTDYGAADICLHCVLAKLNARVTERAAQFAPYRPEYEGGTVDVRDEEER